MGHRAQASVREIPEVDFASGLPEKEDGAVEKELYVVRMSDGSQDDGFETRGHR